MNDDDDYPDAEAARRRDEVVKRMLATPPQPKPAKKTAGKGPAEAGPPKD